jgi:hypothetical protein
MSRDLYGGRGYLRSDISCGRAGRRLKLHNIGLSYLRDEILANVSVLVQRVE